MIDQEGSFSVEAPSNIAFVKYWGKTGRQYPINPSVSMTLKNCVTTCDVTFRKSDRLELVNYRFEGRDNQAFKDRIEKYLHDISDVCPMLNNLAISFETKNSFPHSAGIASSASAFAAIGYALAHIEGNKDIASRASELARLGSGSAARSIKGPYVMWGAYEPLGVSDDYATPLEEVHANFKSVRDVILLVDTGTKSVSSSQGHALMNVHPFKNGRIEQAHHNINKILRSMQNGDWEMFGEVLENEALTLHAMMMTSQPPAILLFPQTLDIISKVREFRRDTALPLYFTIDAGPNVHLIYPEQYAVEIEGFIKQCLAPLCKNGQYISDENGMGTRLIHE